MKVLIWWPGASIAVSDVAAGLTYGLERQGVEVSHYATHEHLTTAGATLLTRWRLRQRQGPKPTTADICYQASCGVIERVLRIVPDWVVMVSGMYQHPDVLLYLKRAGVPVALVCTESPYDLAGELHMAHLADVVFTNERTAVSTFRVYNRRSYYLRHAWHPGVHGLGADTQAPAHDVVFVGTGFQERIDLLGAVDWTDIDFGLYGCWTLVPGRHRLRRHLKAREQPNTMTAALYREAKMGLNLHRSSCRYAPRTRHFRRAESLNPRCYELAACGLPFVTDYRAEVAEVFGAALPTFDGPAALGTLLRRGLQEPAWRADMAAAAHAAVQPHTWTARAAEVLEVLHDAGHAQAA
jgi:spore maturation protein CgeB